ncbi:MAG: aminodeoxychorismate/anthranilate synthase component II [Planctomycetes bacterium]|nr:aminodeoxychorismate/anthranilate synthase component II [Planctomycetota bacterium]
MLLFVDNRDSFSFNLVQALAALGADVRVVRADAASAAELVALRPERVLIGPGPGGPEGAGCSLALAHALRGVVPLFGVCLGHQVLAASFGARVVRAARPVHGHADAVAHDGRGLFRGLPSPLTVGRYHSLVVDPASLPPALEVSARSAAGEVMGLRHRELPIEAVQFHPESVLSEAGEAFFRNLLDA